MFYFNKRIIDSQKLLDNLKLFSNIKLCAMVKANAYGFGMQQMVEVLQPHVEYFGVANFEEAIFVRERTDKKVLLVGKTYQPYDCKENDISYAVTNIYDALYSPKGAKVHLKIDSGMHRLGFCSRQDFSLAIDILLDKQVEIEGVYTHFATLDCDDNYFQKQYSTFKEYLALIPSEINPLIHVGGSWAYGKEIPEAQMLRLGKGIYHGAIKVQSRLIRVFKVTKGARIGYANGFIADKNMTIGIVPVGYADGMRRSLANNYEVIVNDVKCPIVGNICMDMFAVDVSGAQAREGSGVTILYDEKLVAQKLSTNSYEVTTNFNHLRGSTIVCR